MSSALTGNKIKDSYQALLKMGTNGSLDPVTPIAISDGLGNDTPLLLSGIEFKTQVVSAAKLYGIWADLSSNSHLAIGDYAGQYNGTFLYVSDLNKVIQANGGGGINGFNLDFNNVYYQFGDIFGLTSYLTISSGESELFSESIVRISSLNKQTIVNNGQDQLIFTSNDNGTYSGDRGFKLDFANNLYRFGDNTGTTGKFSLLELSSDPAEPNAAILLNENNLRLYGNYGNVGLGSDAGMKNNDAVNYNYKFNSDWQIQNDNITDYPFFYNTLLNTFGNINTEEKAMKYNFFANIQDPSFNIPPFISLTDNRILTNSFIFGLNNYINSNSLGICSEDTNSTFPPTNVVILNGSALEYSDKTNNVFSVNASLVSTPTDTSGLIVLGGDYYDKDSQSYVTANHQFDTTNNIPYGIAIQGNKALVKNTFTRVVSNSFENNSTFHGKVQIEEKQVYKNIDDGTTFQSLLDSRGESKIWLQGKASYFIELKIVSVSSSTVQTSSSGNWVRYIGGLICVDASGVLTKDEKAIADYGQISNMDYNIDISNNNYFIINIKPDTLSGDPCYVKADVKISCVTKN
jgi:hypothetical protein